MFPCRQFSLLAVLTVAAVPGLAQVPRIADEGSFTITLNGRTAGRENFRISATPRGDAVEYLARADVTFGDRKITPELRTDASGAAIEYQAVTRSGSGDEETWRGTVARGRLSATISTPQGTSAREFIVPAGAAILDDDVVHQAWFIARRTQSGRVPVFVPRQNAQSTVSVSSLGLESLQVGTRTLSATHLRLEAGSGATREIWVDADGHLLKVSIPSRGIVALRDDPPRD